MVKANRFELRLDDSLLARIDEWRSEQVELPSRSEAVRGLVLAGLSGGSGGDQQLFEMARMQILTAASNPIHRRNLPPAYVYAWEEGIYPLFHDGYHLHRPFADSFRAGKVMVAELTDFLDDRERRNKVPTFYELEDHFDVRYGKTDWGRLSLMQVCRYMFLHHNMWGDEFWARILKNMEHPAEAKGITRKFEYDDISIT